MNYQQIKTFEDACAVLNLNPASLPDYSMLPEKHQKALTAHTKLVLIAEALNGDWKPDWNNDDEYKYYPWFEMEVSKSNPGGFVLNYVYYYYSGSNVGSRLCFRSREIASHAGTAFVELYKEYMLIAGQINKVVRYADGGFVLNNVNYNYSNSNVGSRLSL